MAEPSPPSDLICRDCNSGFLESIFEENKNQERSEEDVRSLRLRRETLRLQIHEFANRSRGAARNRVLDWAEILMGLQHNSIEMNPENEAEGRRGVSPASKSAIAKLKIIEIESEEMSYSCDVCKDVAGLGEFAKVLPCGHGYHDECIIPWFGARNSCPVCRFELPTVDYEYKERKKKKKLTTSTSSE